MVFKEKSDDYHTMSELYEHRTALFSVICNQNKKLSWKTKLHHPEDENEMYDGYFLAGISTPEGDYTYHCQLEYWDWFNVREIHHAPKFDGHQPKDYPRLFTLKEVKK